MGAIFWLRTIGVAMRAASMGALEWLLAPYHAYLNLYSAAPVPNWWRWRHCPGG